MDLEYDFFCVTVSREKMILLRQFHGKSVEISRIHSRAFLAKISWNCYYLSESEQRVDLTKYKNSLKTNFIGAETVKIALQYGNCLDRYFGAR